MRSPDAPPAKQSPSPSAKGDGLVTQPLHDQLGYALRRAYNAWKERFDQTIRTFGVSPAELATLIIIDANGGLTQSAIGEALSVDRAGMVQIIDNLESGGLVLRGATPGDRRSYTVRLTAQGHGELERLLSLEQDNVSLLLARLSKRERATLQAALLKFG